MNITRSRLLLAGLALFAASCVVAERHTDTIARKWPAAGISRIDVHEINGSVDVIADNAPEITMVAHVSSRGVAPDPKKDNKGYFETNVVGDTLSIGREGRRRHVGFPFIFDSDNLRISYELHVPAAVALDLTTVNGRIETRGTGGETRATTVNGAIDLEALGDSEVTAHTVNGRINAKFERNFQGARFKTVNGSVYAALPASASFDCDVSQINGDFEAAFPLSIHSHPGSRRVSGTVNGGRYALRIVTVNGDIEVASAGGQPVQMTVPPVPQVPVPPPAPPTPPAAQ